MSEKMLENLILGLVAKELKDEIQGGRQVRLANRITHAIQKHNIESLSEQLHAFNAWLNDSHHSFKIPDMILEDYIRYGSVTP